MSHGQWFPSNFNDCALEELEDSLELIDGSSWSQQGDLNHCNCHSRTKHMSSDHGQLENRASGQLGPHTSLSIIGQASRETLFCSQNTTFMGLFQENIQLKAALEAQKQLVTHMMEKDKIVQPATSSHSCLTSSESSESFPSSANNVHSTSQLIIPNSSPQCYQDNYEDVLFWTRAEWIQYEHKERERGEKFHKLRFISQENGSMVDNARLSAIGKEATELWNTLYHTHNDPPSWKSKTKIASALPSFNGKQKIENNDEDVDHKKILKSTPPQSLNHLKRQPPSPRNIINLNSYSDSTSKSLAGPSRSKGKKRATSITSIISSLTPPPQQEIPRASAQRNPQNTHHTPPPRPLAPLYFCYAHVTIDSPTPATTAPSTDSTPSVTGTNVGLLPPSTSAPTSSKNVSACLTIPLVEDPRPGSTSSMAVSDNLDSDSPQATAPTGTSSESASNEKEPLAGVGDSDTGSMRHTLSTRWPYQNILLNLSIPKPADDLLALVTEIAPLTAVTSTKTGKTTTKQGVKLMEANESLTARNLFAIEYLKSHSPTVSEFKAIYDALDHDVNKQYEVLSREKKREATSITSSSK